MNRRNFVGLLAASAVAAITPAWELFTSKQEFSGETIPSGNIWCLKLDRDISFSRAEYRALLQLLASRDAKPQMRVRFQGTRNPYIRLTSLERLA